MCKTRRALLTVSTCSSTRLDDPGCTCWPNRWRGSWENQVYLQQTAMRLLDRPVPCSDGKKEHYQYCSDQLREDSHIFYAAGVLYFWDCPHYYCAQCPWRPVWKIGSRHQPPCNISQRREWKQPAFHHMSELVSRPILHLTQPKKKSSN